MNTFFLLCRGYVIFVAASGFLLGQLYFNTFELPATLAGVYGLLAGALSGRYAEPFRLRRFLVFLCCLASLFGVALDAYGYYQNSQHSGSYYAWFMIGPFVACLIFIASRLASDRPSDKSLRGAVAASRQAPEWTRFGILALIPGLRDLPTRWKLVLTLFLVALISIANYYLSGGPG